MTDPKGYLTTYGYDASWNLTRVTDPLNRVTTMAYDSVGRQTSVTDAKNQTTTYQYDTLDRQTRVTYHDGTYVAYTYDGNGNVTQMVDPTGTTSYEYDAANRMTRKTVPGGSVITFGYDDVGNLLQVVDAGGTVSYLYNEINLLIAVIEQGGPATSISYDILDRVTSIAYPNGVTTYKDWDDAGRLTRIRAEKAGVVLTSFSYSYVNPSTGQTTDLRYSVTDKDSNVATYTYDDAARLTAAVTRNSGGTMTDNRAWAFDANSNWTSRTINGVMVNHSYDNANQLTSMGGFPYTWDSNGNLTGDDIRTTTYNAADQTTSIYRRSTQVTTNLAYSGLGQTERVTRGSDSYQYNTLGIGPGSERDSAGVVTAYTRAANGDLLGFRRNSARYYYLYDGLGSVAAVTDANGAVVNRYSYDPYGNALSTSEQVTQFYRYAGAYLDSATNLYKMGARYYDPATGRFTQRDAMPASAYNPLEYNRYAYVAGNPVNHTDRTGYAQWVDPYQGYYARPLSRYSSWAGYTPFRTYHGPWGGYHNVYSYSSRGYMSPTGASHLIWLSSWPFAAAARYMPPPYSGIGWGGMFPVCL